MTKAVTKLRDMDGLSYRANSARLPHPALLRKWEDRGFIETDLASDCFRLTSAGRQAADIAERHARIRQITDRAAGVTDDTVSVEFGS